MAAKLLSVACIRNESGNMSSRPLFPPKGESFSSDEEKCVEGIEVKALFSVSGMTCSACAASVEKAVKRLPGVKDAAVDVLNHRSLVVFCPAFVSVSPSSSLPIFLFLFLYYSNKRQRNFITFKAYYIFIWYIINMDLQFIKKVKFCY